jgi:hypothetical protein
MTMKELLEQLKELRIGAKQFFPDDDAKNAGYLIALADVIELIETSGAAE